MRALLLGLAAPIAAMTTFAAPAAALDPPAKRSVAGSASGVTIHHGLPPQFRDGGHRDHDGGRDWRRHDRDRDRDRDRGRDRRGDGDTYFAYRDYQGSTVWQSNSYNDWWHDRPDRSYPRWMAHNQDCQRVWWSGGGWRC